MTHSTAERRSLRGFTLTEVLIAIAIFAIIFVAALLVYDRSNRVFNKSMQASDLQQETRVAFDTLVADLRMAGFDFNRDGAPIGANAFEQPDEQLEFINAHAITFRSNLDYETDAANDNGRETDYEPGFATPADPDDDFFPLVTTGNDEIVTYALVSDDGANDDSITFYADVAKPRKTYPGGTSETLVTISGVDLCDTGCNEPPYTLNRITLADDGTPVFTPLANNIRSLELEYYSDAQQAAASLVTPNGGAGQFTVSGTSTTTTAAAAQARSVRSSIQSIRMRLVGMNANVDANYQSPIEAALPLAEQVAMNYRQYDLETNIVPRNLGRAGMAEFPTTPPGAPEVTNVCQQGCGVIRVEWKAPEYGTVDSYGIIYDTASDGPYGSTPVSAGNLFGFVGGLDPNTTYYFKVVAKNSYGTERSDNYGGGIKPINPTQPAAPTVVSATGDGTVPPQANNITLTFHAPESNVAFNGVNPVNSCGILADEIQSLQENNGYQVIRSTIKDFDPASQGTIIFNGPLAGATDLTVDSSGNGTYVDKSSKINCTPYYYRIRVKETCAAAPALNTSGNINQAFSAWSEQFTGESAAVANPAAPTSVSITTTSKCDGIPGDPASSCSVTLLWDRVTKDIADPVNTIQVSEYEVRRVFADLGIENDSTEVFFTVTDTTPEAVGQMTWVNTTATDSSLLQPNPGDRYHYYVRAKQCGNSFVSTWSTPKTQFPCAVVSVGAPSPAPLEGNGVSSPYLIYANSAGITLQANKNIGTASMAIYIGKTNTLAPSQGSVSHLPPSDTATFTVPLNTQVYRAEMTMIDQTGCGTTIVRYFQQSFTGCCLIPFKTVTNTANDATVLTASGNTVKVTLKNQCSSALTVSRIRFRWNSIPSAYGTLTGVTYPDGTSQTGATLVDLENGNVTDGIAILKLPVATKKIVPANGSYTITLTFDKNGNSTTITDFPNFCVEYDDGTGVAQCKIIQGPAASGSECVFP